MTNKQKLQKLIDCAVAHGWDDESDLTELSVSDVLFDPQFAKAVFPDWVELMPWSSMTSWEWHLQELAITEPEKRINYAYNNMRKD